MSKTWSDSLHAQITAGWTAASWALVLPAVPPVDSCCLVCAAYRSSLSANHIPPQDIFRCIFLRPSPPQGHFWGLSSSPSAITVLSAIRWQEIRSTPQTCQHAPWFRACAGPCSYLRKEDEDRVMCGMVGRSITYCVIKWPHTARWSYTEESAFSRKSFNSERILWGRL